MRPNERFSGGNHPRHLCRECARLPAGEREYRRGELWYARVFQPPIPGGSEHVVFMTPYLVLEPGLREWQAYFLRTLPDAPPRRL